MTEVLSELTPQEEVAGSESGGGEEPHVAPTMVAEENIEDHRPVKESTDQLIRTTNHSAEEEEVEIISSPPENRAKGPILQPLFQTPSSRKARQNRHLDIMTTS